MGTLAPRITDVQGLIYDTVLPAINMPGLGRHLVSGGTATLRGVNTIIVKESYLNVGQFKIPLRRDTDSRDTDSSTID